MFPVYAILIAILLGPATVIQVGNRTPIVLWADLIVLLMAVYTALRLAPFLKKASLPWIFWAYLAYLLVATLSLALTRDWMQGMAAWKLRVMPPLALLIAYSSIRDTASARRLGSAFGFTGGVVAILTIANWIIISRGGVGAFNSPVVSSKDMAQTSFGTSNYLATILIFCLPWCMIHRFKSRLLNYSLSFGSAGTMLWALLLTQSRGALISATAGGLLFALELGLAHRIRLRTVLSVFLAMAFAAITAYWIWSMAPDVVASDLVKRMDLLISDFAEGKWQSNRTDVWIPALDYITAHPVVGLGLGNQALAGDLLGSTNTAHNVLLEAWLELGPFGFLPLAALLYGGWRTWHLIAFGPDRSVVSLGLAGVFSLVMSIMHCMGEPSFWGPQFAYLFWMALGTGLAIQRQQKVQGARSSSEVQTC